MDQYLGILIRLCGLVESITKLGIELCFGTFDHECEDFDLHLNWFEAFQFVLLNRGARASHRFWRSNGAARIQNGRTNRKCHHQDTAPVVPFGYSWVVVWFSISHFWFNKKGDFYTFISCLFSREKLTAKWVCNTRTIFVRLFFFHPFLWQTLHFSQNFLLPVVSWDPSHWTL